MSDLISRSALSKWCHETMSAQTTTVGMAYIRDFWNKVIDAPDVDAVEVVRCKDCRLSRPLNRKDPFEDKFVEGCVWCMEHGDGMFENDFCSYGERREDG